MSSSNWTTDTGPDNSTNESELSEIWEGTWVRRTRHRLAINANKHELGRKAGKRNREKRGNGIKNGHEEGTWVEEDGWEERRHYVARGKKANQTGRDDSRGALIALNGPRRFSMRVSEGERERELSFSGPCWCALSKCLWTCEPAHKIVGNSTGARKPAPYRRQTPISAIFIEAPSRQLTLPKVI